MAPWPADAGEWERYQLLARSALSEEAFADARATGRRLVLADAVAEALSVDVPELLTL